MSHDAPLRKEPAAMQESEKQKNLLGKFVRRDESGNLNPRKPDELDLTRPAVFIGLTLAYVCIVFCIVIGVPWQGLHPEPIPPEDLPVAITVFVLLYLVVFGGFYFRDKRRRKRRG
jgi:hypothetical protein